MTNRITPAVASARKSLGEYKPLIKVGGRTEVVEQNPDRFARNTRGGMVQGNRYARGTTYSNRGDAIAAAQRMIDSRLADAIARHADFTVNQPNYRGQCIREILVWGGTAPIEE